ncbi:MAG TPA: glutamyl-tRNA reductase [Methanoregulaceae archaeon]|nr:glutamyl-tRNA reductase [Methanoregulaceae archaeon]
MSEKEYSPGQIDEPCFSPLAIAGINHHTADVAAIEEFRFPDETAFLADTHERFKGAVLLQTCNRVEVLVHGEGDALADFLRQTGRHNFTLFEGTGALRHILEISCGIDSMIVGEDQIIGQLRTAMTRAQEAGTSDSILELCINKAIHVGVECRKRTRINRGAVSVGSAAVLLAEEQIGSLRGRHILVIGSGEMGLLVTQALAAKDLTAIYVANRTHERAIILAEKIGGKAVTFDELNRYLVLSDVVISCTAAPHPIIREGDLREVMKGRCWPLDGHPRPLILIDIAQPRDVEESAGSIPGVHLYTIDDLRQVNDCTMASRQEEAERAMGFIEEELAHFVHLLNRKAADDTIAMLHTWAEAIRVRERDRATGRLVAKDDKTSAVIDDLTRVLVTKLLNDATFSIRSCAEAGDLESAESLVAAIVRGEKICIRKEE